MSLRNNYRGIFRFNQWSKHPPRALLAPSKAILEKSKDNQNLIDFTIETNSGKVNENSLRNYDR